MLYAFDTEDCPGGKIYASENLYYNRYYTGDCHCHLDGLLMLVDCSGLEMSELPEFPDNQVCCDSFSNFQFEINLIHESRN